MIEAGQAIPSFPTSARSFIRKTVTGKKQNGGFAASRRWATVSKPFLLTMSDQSFRGCACGRIRLPF